MKYQCPKIIKGKKCKKKLEKGMNYCDDHTAKTELFIEKTITRTAVTIPNSNGILKKQKPQEPVQSNGQEEKCTFVRNTEYTVGSKDLMESILSLPPGPVDPTIDPLRDIPNCFCGEERKRLYALNCDHAVHRDCIYLLENYNCKECDTDIRKSNISAEDVEHANLMKAVELLVDVKQIDMKNDDDVLITEAVKLIDEIRKRKF